MRLLVARCEVVYTGRLNAVLAVSTRLIAVKADGCSSTPTPLVTSR